VYADEGAGRKEWYQALADRANADLEAAGFPRCSGGYMAQRWNGPLSEWVQRFSGWIDSPSAQARLEASVFFDYRRVAGQLSLDRLDAVLAEAPKSFAFLRFLAKSAMEFRPPGLLLLRLRGGSSEVDLKAHGITPVVSLARCYALEAGSVARNTVERIEAAARAGLLDAETAEIVSEAYGFLIGLRLRIQLRLLSEEEPPTNQIALSELTGIERSRLKEAFRAIRGFQDRAEFHYRTDF
jgi:CBS domain-containing protein